MEGPLSKKGRHFLLWVLGILLLPTFFRYGVIGRFDLGNDEAHYYMYSLHPALSYFDHPLMVALLIRTGISLFGTTSFGVRFFAPTLFFVSSILLTMIAVTLLPRRKVVLWTLVLVNAIPLFGYLGSMLMLPDAPLSVFWLLYILVSLVLFGRYEQLSRGVRNQGWVLLGVLFGLSLLSKYNGVLLAPATFLFLYFSPNLRSLLKSFMPYLALFIGFVVAAPLFLWNLQNGGASFSFQMAHGLGLGFHFGWVSFYQMVFGQIGYVSPILFFVILGILWGFLRGKAPFPPRSRPLAILLWFSFLPLIFFNLIGVIHPILPHWPAMGYLTAIPLMGILRQEGIKSRALPWIDRGAVLGLSMSALVTLQLFFRPLVLPASVPLWVDITNDLFGFRTMAQKIQLEIAAHPEKMSTPFFFAAEHFNTADEVAFYLDRPYHTICLSHRMTQFDFWTDPHQMIGKNGLFITTDKYNVDPSTYYPTGTFDQVIPLRPIVILRRGTPARIFYLYWLIGFRQVPFRQQKEG